MLITRFDDSILDRMVAAVERVRDRLRRCVSALEDAGIRHAVVGGNAVAAWVASIDEEAIRTTGDVDILLQREDLEKAKEALARVGFRYRHVKSIDMFLDGPDGNARSAVHVLFAGEKVRPDDPAAIASMDETEMLEGVGVGRVNFVSLEALVRMKLISYRDKDRTHLRDMIDIGLIDQTWPARFQPELAERLQALLDDPDG